jgi:hypothetical protein
MPLRSIGRDGGSRTHTTPVPETGGLPSSPHPVGATTGNRTRISTLATSRLALGRPSRCLLHPPAPPDCLVQVQGVEPCPPGWKPGVPPLTPHLHAAVAEVGFEHHDLRDMSPAGTAPPLLRIIASRGAPVRSRTGFSRVQAGRVAAYASGAGGDCPGGREGNRTPRPRLRPLAFQTSTWHQCRTALPCGGR